jgi:hypothetical protein
MSDDAGSQKKQINYKEERALFFARNKGRTTTRIWFMYAAAIFFGVTAFLRTFFVDPFTWWDLSGFAFVAVAAFAAIAMRRLYKEGERLLAERGETVTRPSLRDLRRRPQK